MKNILITGGAGFVGSSIIGQVQSSKQWNIKVLDDLSFGTMDRLETVGFNGEFVKGDIRDESTTEHYKNIDVVIHCAAIAPLPDNQSQPYDSLSVNVAGTARVLELAKQAGVPKIIVMSSGAIYEGATHFPNREDDVIDTSLVYPGSKHMTEIICNNFQKAYDMDIVCLRLFNLYGPLQDYHRKQPPLMGYLIRSALQQQTAELYSDGKQKRDYVFINDLVDLILRIANAPKNSHGRYIYNACSGVSYSVRNILEILGDIVGHPVLHNFNDPKNFWGKYESLFMGQYPLNRDLIVKEVNKYTQGSNFLAQQDYGWEPQYSMKDGLADCVQYAQDYFKKDAA